MWWLGFYLDGLRISLFLLLTLPLLVGLSFYGGFEKTFYWRDDLMDALSAYAAAYIVTAAILALIGVIDYDESWRDILGQIALQAVPASMGAVLARPQLGHTGGGREEKPSFYLGELFLMLAGALFVAFNVAPAEEMILIAYKMSEWQTLALALASIFILHTLVYSVGFGSQEEDDGSFLSVLLRYTIVGFAIALLVSLYMLWTFERTDAVDSMEILKMTVVLAFPAAIGAALARLMI